MWIFLAFIAAIIGNMPFVMFFLIMELLFGCNCPTFEGKYRKQWEKEKKDNEQNR